MSKSNGQNLEKIVHDWNKTERVYADQKTLHALFEEQVVRFPENIAIIYDDKQLTYADVNERANALAHYIQREYAIKPDDLVALCLDRNEDMLITLLAVLKSGGAYVPIDSAYPDDRITYILEDTQTKLILAHRCYADRFSVILGRNRTVQFASIVAIDAESLKKILAEESKINPKQVAKSSNLAYVTYTSGTTGKPKGVMTEHRAVVNRISYFTENAGVDSGFNILAKTAYVFDACSREIYLALLNGAKLVLLDDIARRDPKKLLEAIETHQIHLMLFVPSQLQMFMNFVQEEQVPKQVFNSLKYVYVSGEPFKLKDAQQLLNYAPALVIKNQFGSTECCMVQFEYSLDRSSLSDRVCIGKPLSNVKAYVLNQDLSPTSIGTVGELYVGGEGLARGYLNQPKLTAERFIKNPFQTDKEKRSNKNTRLYKTGDLVKWLPDGNLEHIGRNDFQIKILGYRVELEEIEAVLADYSDVKQSVVLVKEQVDRDGRSNGSHYLLGYYVSAHRLDEEKLFAYLKSKLADYMIPAALIHLTSLPLTINGKLDREALPIPKLTHDDSYVAPSTQKEIVMCRIWEEVLGIEQIGIRDDFFRLGGNSVLAMRVLHKMNQALGQCLSIVSIFELRCIANLAHCALKHDTVQITVSDISKPPLSFAQERLWFIEQYESGTDAYHIPLVLLLRSDIHLPSFKKALNAIVARHSILRTIFVQDESGDYYQHAQQGELIIPEKEIDSTRIQEAIQSVLHKPFQLGEEWPIRVWLYHVKENVREEMIAVINIHHVAFDGWSEDIFHRELEAFYYDYQKGLPSNLEKLPIAYKDYAVWQRSYLSGKELSRQLEYWKEKLAGYQPLDFPLDRARPSRIDYRGNTVDMKLGADLSDQLRQLAKAQGVTLYTVLLSGFMVLLSKYSGQEDIVLGTPIANRHYPELSDLVGFFVNTLAIRNHVSKEISVEKFIQLIHMGMIEAQSHPDLPFEKLVDVLGVERDLSRHPIFQVVFGVHSFGQHQRKKDNSSLYALYSYAQEYPVAKFDLSLFIDDGASELLCSFNYALSLFNQSTIERLSRHYECVLKAFVRDSRQLIKHLQILSDAELQQISLMNETAQIFTGSDYLHQGFIEQAVRTPDAIAVQDKNSSFTYKKLEEVSNQLAHQLRALKVKPNQLIAVVMEKSAAQVIAVMGILKAGAAYLPVSIHEPAKRLEVLLEQGEVQVVLTQERHRCKLDAKYIVLSVDTPFPEGVSKTFNETPPQKKSDLAYVIFTSGSTGLPKGVMLSHQSALNTIQDMNTRFRVNADDCILGLSALNFDLSVYDIFGGLAVGAKLLLPAEEEMKDQAAWYQLFQEHRITIWNSTPALMEMFVSYIESSRKILLLQSLRLVLLSGDWIPPSLPQRIKKVFGPEVEIISLGGATEGAIWSILYPIRHVASDWKSIPYGKPMANQTFYILNEQLQHCPVGVPGELYIGGVGVASGYWRDPERTHKSFITHPNGERLYKTGDLGRFLEDGNIEFLGRLDHQVKIRGYRVELGEIESSLKAHPQIKEAIVVMKRENISDTSLIAYYIVKDGASLDRTELKTHLKSMLPEYMVPTQYVSLDIFPLNANGKIDKKSLPVSIEENTDSETYVAPRNSDEEDLVAIWASLLEVNAKKIGIHHSFFDLGGHSLLAAKVIAKVNMQFDTSLSVRDLFENPSIDSFVEVIMRNRWLSGMLLEQQGQYELSENGEI